MLKKQEENIRNKLNIIVNKLLSRDYEDAYITQRAREGSIVITKLQEAYHWLLQRQIDRKQRQVEGTYKK